MAFLGPRARLNIAAITSRDIAEFRKRHIALGLAPATVNLDISILSSRVQRRTAARPHQRESVPGD